NGLICIRVPFGPSSYRYREMEIWLIAGGDCRLTTGRSAPEHPLARAATGIVKWKSGSLRAAIVG
ncbi:hypothetical protein, partial [Aeromonas caviae]|uniref:hypothetical protein n=1 Tax=Aeromonas caviae TaxID=648 RepID=UPI0025B71092